MILDELATYLAANSTLTVGGTLGKARMTDTQPDTVGVLYESGGLSTVYTFSTGSAVEYQRPTVQFLSRSTSYVTARQAAETVYQLLDGLSNTTMTGVRYKSVKAIQQPFTVGVDDSDRYLVSVNFQCERATT